MLEHKQCVDRLEYLWPGWQTEVCAEPAQQFETKGMEGAHPEALSRLWRNLANPCAHLLSRFVREGQRQDRGGVDSFFQKERDSPNQRLRLSGTWSCLNEQWSPLRIRSLLLARVED